jgi:uncharacterized membrane protein HdeD (DUF308 family)
MATMGTTAAGPFARGVAMLADRWWALALRGAAAVIFGILTFVSPGASLLALVVIFGAYAIVNGAIEVWLAFRAPAGEPRWGWLLFEGIASIVAGVLTLFWPGITALVLLLFIAVWAIATGIGQVVAAVRLRKTIKGEWRLALMVVLSIAFGVILFLYPSSGALALVLWIGAYAIVLGALLIALAFKLRSWGRTTTREAPPGAVPVTR